MLVDQGYLTAQRNDDDLWILQNNTYMNADYYHGLPEEDAQLKEVPTKAKYAILYLINVELLNKHLKFKQISISVFVILFLIRGNAFSSVRLRNVDF